RSTSRSSAPITTRSTTACWSIIAGWSSIPATSAPGAGSRAIALSRRDREAPRSGDAVVFPVPGDKARQADRDRDLRREAEIAPGGFDIGISACHIAGLHRHHLLDRHAAERLFQYADEVGELFRAVIAEVVEAMLARPGRRRLGRGNDRRHDVVDIGEVAF